MNISKVYFAAGLIIALSLFMAIVARADESDQATKINFSQPMQIPGQVLPAGTYVFTLLSSDADRHIVQVFNADRTVLYATLQTIRTDRPKPTVHTVIALAERGNGRPDVLLKWFYPECETGNQFIYPKQEEKELTQDKQQTVVADEPTASNSDMTGAGN